MSAANKAEQAVAYAALILADESVVITPEKLQTLLQAAGIEDIEPIWTTLFANALKDKDIKDILTTVAASGPAVGGENQQHGKTDGQGGEDDGANGKDDDEGIVLNLDSDDDGDFIGGIFD